MRTRLALAACLAVAAFAPLAARALQRADRPARRGRADRAPRAPGRELRRGHQAPVLALPAHGARHRLHRRNGGFRSSYRAGGAVSCCRSHYRLGRSPRRRAPVRTRSGLRTHGCCGQLSLRSARRLDGDRNAVLKRLFLHAGLAQLRQRQSRSVCARLCGSCSAGWRCCGEVAL
jgi:hypothetical protein